MAGRIRDADVATVRERSPLPEIVGEHVALRGAGGDRLKGLCPFHDEKTASFHVNPGAGFWHCFGCGMGGDVITFLREIEQLTFVEAVERLALRAGIELTYEGGGAAPRGQTSRRGRLLAANQAAARFYVEQLPTPVAEPGRDFLRQRGFDAAVADEFGIGFAPPGWDTLVRHLRDRGFSDDELLTSGVASSGRHGPIDRFRGRLVWPIRDKSGDVIGFGARRLREDDPGPKYLNTPETPLYRKSHVLYGLDRAKREIARRRQAVVVEGYTDVMACHLAGVPTAVATCGTTFGSDHIGVLRPILMDQDEFRGEVIFTFDGDAAGQKAALRAFAEDQRFVTQTFVAVEPEGLDPCDLRLSHGDLAVRDLVAARVPLFEFAIRSVLDRHDLTYPEGRIAALTAAAPVVASIRDRALRPEYARILAGWLGMEVEPVLARVREDSGRGPSVGGSTGRSTGGSTGGMPAGRAASGAPSPTSGTGRSPADGPVAAVEREALKIAIQRPALAGPSFDALESEMFTVPGYADLHKVVEAAGGVAVAGGGGGAWVERLRELAGDDATRAAVTELAVEAPLTAVLDDRYALQQFVRLRELAATRRIVEVKSSLQRLNPVEQQADYNRLFGELVALEQHKRGLREQAADTL